MLTKIALAVAALMFLTPGLGLGADVLPRAQRPEDVGFSTERLARLTRITQEHVEAGRLPGAVNPCSLKLMPAIAFAAIFASGWPIAFDTNGIVRDARGFTSRT